MHDWIWYFGHGCRQFWRRLGMCDHRALWPPQLRVFLSCLGPKTWTITPLNFYCRSAVWQKPQPATTHTEEKMTTLETTVLSDVQEKWSISSFTRLQMVQWLSPALGVGDRRAESLSCSCQWLDQDLHLWHMGQHSVRLLLPSAGFPPRRSEQASEIKWALFILPTVLFFGWCLLFHPHTPTRLCAANLGLTECVGWWATLGPFWYARPQNVTGNVY